MAYKFQGIPKPASAQLDDESKLKLKNEIKNEIMNEVRKEIAKEIQEIKEAIIRERDNRMKITNWIRDNVGPDMEHVKELIDEAVDRKLRESQGSVAPSSVAPASKQTRVPVFPVSQPTNNNNTQPQPARPLSQSNPQPAPSTIQPQTSQAPPAQNQRASTLKSSSSMKELQSQIQAQLAKTSISNQPSTPADDSNENTEQQKSARVKKEPQQPATTAPVEIYSDEEWTDTDEEEKEKEAEQIKKKLHAKVAKANKKLVEIEEKAIPKPGKLSKQDSTSIPTLSKANMQHSTSIHLTTYGSPTEVLFPKMKELHAKGGSVIFVPPGKTENDPFLFAIKKNDVFYPVCPDGLGRSQVMYLVLTGMQRALGMEPNINLPHGALYGFDVARQDLLSFIPKGQKETEGKPFRTSFGQHRMARYGESVGKAYANSLNWKQMAEPAQQMREYFNLFFYKQPQKKVGSSSDSEPGRIVFVVFAQAVPVVLDRLNEMNKSGLERVVVIGIPFEDETNVSKDHPDLKRYNLQRDQLCVVKHHEAYKKYASLFFPLLHTDSIQ